MAPNGLAGQNPDTNTEMASTVETRIERRKGTVGNFSASHFLKHGIIGDTFGEKLAWSFCACAIIANLTSVILHFTIDYLENSPSAKAAALLWAASVILAGISAILFSVPLQRVLQNSE
jgi:hypothetical protein